MQTKSSIVAAAKDRKGKNVCESGCIMKLKGSSDDMITIVHAIK